MMPILRCSRALALLPTLALVACTTRVAAPSLVPPAIAPVELPAALRGDNDAKLALATFDTVWRTIRDTHYDTGFKGVNWNAVRAELRPKVEVQLGTQQLRAVISEMLARLGESHYALIPSEVAESWTAEPRDDEATMVPGDAGLDLRIVDGKIVVSKVAPGGGGALADVRAGWIVERIGDREMAPLLAAFTSAGTERARRASLVQIPKRAERWMEGATGSSIRVLFRDGDDRRVMRLIERRPVQGEIVQFGYLPPTAVVLEHERLDTPTGCTGVIRLNAWMTPIMPAFDRAITELRDCEGIVLDLRGNLGGVAAMVMGVSGHFLDREVALGIMRMRNNQLRFVSNPRRTTADGKVVTPYAGPLAILIDPLSASTSEIFASGMQYQGRARLFGEISAGQALPALLHRLPNGDVLMHVMADFTMPDGARVEGRGSIPDEVVALTRSGLLAGVDAPLVAARKWIEGERSRHLSLRLRF